MAQTPDLGTSLKDFVATVEIQRPPHNFFDYSLIQQLAETFEELDANDACRAIMLCAQGKSFCAGANFGDGSTINNDGSAQNAPNTGAAGHLYMEAVRLFACKKPIVGAIQGAAIGGGLGGLAAMLRRTRGRASPVAGPGRGRACDAHRLDLA